MKLIIVDDELAIRNGLTAAINEFGLDIQVAGTAEDGEAALSLLSAERPEIILLDICMPKLDGLSLQESIHRLLPDSRVIIISSYDDFTFAQKALRLGAFDYLLKPLNHALLRNVLLAAMEAHRKRAWELDMISAKAAGMQDLAGDDPVAEALRLISLRYTEPELSLDTLAKQLHTSAANLSNGIKKRTGQSFSGYLKKLRIEQAIAYLRSPQPILIYDIAYRVGYSSQHYFCRVFKEYTGKSPSEFRTDYEENG